MKKLFLLLILVFPPLAVQAAADDFDPAVSGISVSPSEPAVNQPVTVTINCRNLGTQTMPSFDADNYTRNFQNFAIEGSSASGNVNIGPNGSFSLIFTGYFTAVDATTRLGIVINPDGGAPDFKSSNNSFSLDINVVKQYDFSLESIEVFPSKPIAGQAAKITVKAKNAGFAQLWTGAGWNSVRYSFPHFTIDSSVLPTINSDHPVKSGEYFYYTYSGEFSSSGAKNLEFWIDDGNQVDEKDEGNNHKSYAATVYNENNADISVDALGFSLSEPIAGQEGVITAKIKNSGLSSLIGNKGFFYENGIDNGLVIPKEIVWNFPGFEIKSAAYPEAPSFLNPLDPGETLEYKFSGRFKEAASTSLEFSFNTNKRLPESSFLNNTKSAGVRIYSGAEARDEFSISSLRYEFESQEAVVLYWTASRSLGSTLFYKPADYTSWNESVQSANTAFNKKISGLRPGVYYGFRASAKNGAVEKTTGTLNLKMPENNNLVLASGPTVQSAGADAAVINFSSNLIAEGEIGYRLKGASGYSKKTLAKKSVFAEKLEKLAIGDYEYYIALKSAPGTTLRSAVFDFSIASATAAKPIGAAQSQAQAQVQTQAQIQSPISAPSLSSEAKITNQALYAGLKGKIVLAVEQKGEAYYIHPAKLTRFFLGRPADAFAVMRSQGIGIKNIDLEKIPIGLIAAAGPDADGDGLSDLLEDAIGTDKSKKDTDGDGYDDKSEVSQGFNPKGAGNKNTSLSFAGVQKGKILLQVEGKGEAWYVSPANGKRYFLGRPADAFAVMRSLGLGISNENFGKL